MNEQNNVNQNTGGSEQNDNRNESTYNTSEW